eukprot:6487742-Amphidinium_carterae.1
MSLVEVLPELNQVAIARTRRNKRLRGQARQELQTIAATALSDVHTEKEARAAQKTLTLRSDSAARSSNRVFIVALDQQLRTAGIVLADFRVAEPLQSLSCGCTRRRRASDGKVLVESANAATVVEWEVGKRPAQKTWFAVSDMGPKSWTSFQALTGMQLNLTISFDPVHRIYNNWLLALGSCQLKALRTNARHVLAMRKAAFKSDANHCKLLEISDMLQEVSSEDCPLFHALFEELALECGLSNSTFYGEPDH